MIVSIHQPEFFPYPGYLNKMAMADTFVILDDVQYKKNNFQNRNRILHKGKEKWLTLPIDEKGRLSSTIRDTRIADTVDWRLRSLKSLTDAYSEAPYYNDLMPELTEIFCSANSSLLDLNMTIIKYFREKLSINSEIIFSSDLHTESHKSDLVLEICEKVGASLYLSGAGGREYLSMDRFESKGVKVLFQSPMNFAYHQFNSDDFVSNLSTIDLLMNHDTEYASEHIRTSFYYTED